MPHEAGIPHFHTTPISGSGRLPYCMIGHCFDCLMEIDGASRQACLSPVRHGMKIRTQTGAATIFGNQLHDHPVEPGISMRMAQ